MSEKYKMYAFPLKNNIIINKYALFFFKKNYDSYSENIIYYIIAHTL